ncbi:copper amine oxidase N-terminal domain-containing protein [Paenibacillus sp. LHD-117]|uniref:copper amine oxidase N-terminal domain-containing protein n=1 Tax=Paenibacillus sp. LHD-117 TaxID=3071412 RepID=UPI0027DF40EB|nr:copper amine oxidase N-terminal domain-containing protein [Paenibacillus sp. LHD-117]MDQ6420407.1 copper amine oxidase N-terminal domain-containing protein [Paenibacillus sp. LHD-117]
MKNNRKKVAAMIAAMTMTAALPATLAFGADHVLPSVQFQIGSLSAVDNDGTIALKQAPYIEQGVAMVPARAFAEGLDAKLTWDPIERTVHMERSGLTVLLTVGENSVTGTYVKNVKLPAKVVIKQGQAFIPAKSVADLLGASTTWEQASRKVMIQAKGESVSHTFKFDQGQDGWEGGFADLPVAYNPDIYNLSFDRELIKLEDNSTNYGLKLNGMNRSDDLFMFAAKKISGLAPNTTYDASLAFKLYTDQAGGMVGVGGALGEAVHIKAGFVATKPEVVRLDHVHEVEPFYILNADKGNQATEGADLKIVGNMVKPDDTVEGFQSKTMNHQATLKSNAAGELFVIIGSDSGYEGLTTWYLDDVQVDLVPKG